MSTDKIKPNLPPCRSKFGRVTMLYAKISQAFHEINCGSWRCPRCRLKWAKKWSAIIKWILATYNPENLLLVNLTTAEYTDHTQIELALQKTVRRLRRLYGNFEYVKVVEYNQNQTQPHFHLICVFEKYEIPPIPLNWDNKKAWPEPFFYNLSAIWSDELTKAKAKAAPVVWCQPPQGNGAAAATYAVGYITGSNKADKNAELPNDTWKGRRLTYSKHFFGPYNTKEIWQKIKDKWFGSRPDEELIPVIAPKFWDLREATDQEYNEVMVISGIPLVAMGTSWLKEEIRKTVYPEIISIDNQYAFVFN